MTVQAVHIPAGKEDMTCWALLSYTYTAKDPANNHAHSDILVFNKANNQWLIFETIRLESLRQPGLPGEVNAMCAKFDKVVSG